MQIIYLDISNKGVIPCINAKQGEVGRKFLAVITDNGLPYAIPDDSLLSVWYDGDTDSGTYSSINDKSAFSVDGNKVTVELVAQMLLQPGNGELCLSITHADGRESGTWNISYHVERKPGAGSSVPTEYYTALTEAGSVAAQYATSAKKDAEVAASYGRDFLLTIYPVGSIYMTLSSSYPGNIFGGTWERIEGRFLLGSSATHYAGQTGGSETHTLTVSELAQHSHLSRTYLNSTGSVDVPANNSLLTVGSYKYSTSGETEKSSSLSGKTETTGSSTPFSIMPPYISVHIWQRTA